MGSVDHVNANGIIYLYPFLSPSPVVIACCGVYRDKGNNFAAHFHIDLIDSITQILIVFRKDPIFGKQVLRWQSGHTSTPASARNFLSD